VFGFFTDGFLQSSSVFSCVIRVNDYFKNKFTIVDFAGLWLSPTLDKNDSLAGNPQLITERE
jgi:hypothetical protein